MFCVGSKWRSHDWAGGVICSFFYCAIGDRPWADGEIAYDCCLVVDGVVYSTRQPFSYSSTATPSESFFFCNVYYIARVWRSILVVPAVYEYMTSLPSGKYMFINYVWFTHSFLAHGRPAAAPRCCGSRVLVCPGGLPWHSISSVLLAHDRKTVY